MKFHNEMHNSFITVKYIEFYGKTIENEMREEKLLKNKILKAYHMLLMP